MLIYSNKELDLEIYPLDSTRWNDFEILFGERGACGGCWCMSWRIKRSDFERQKGNQNRMAMKTLVEQHRKTGVLAYMNNEPIGWCYGRCLMAEEDWINGAFLMLHLYLLQEIKGNCGISTI